MPIVLLKPENRRGPTRVHKERSEGKMFYGDYSYELAKERMEGAIRAREHDLLVKQLRTAAPKAPRKSMVARGTAVVMALFR